VTNRRQLFSASNADEDDDSGTVEFPNNDERGNPASNGPDDKKLLNSEDKLK